MLQKSPDPFMYIFLFYTFICTKRLGKSFSTYDIFSYLFVAVYRDAEQSGEIHQAAAADHVGDISFA